MPKKPQSADQTPAAGSAPPEGAVQATMNRRELAARISEILGDPKKVAREKELVDATLLALGQALAQGRQVSIAPFGKARVAKTKGDGVRRQLTVKLKGAGEKNAPKAVKLPLAEGGEDS